jgi:hypothetical protein
MLMLEHLILRSEPIYLLNTWFLRWTLVMYTIIPLVECKDDGLIFPRRFDTLAQGGDRDIHLSWILPCPC